jgi:serine protease
MVPAPRHTNPAPRSTAAVVVVLALLLAAAAWPSAAIAADYVPNEVLVGYSNGSAAARIQKTMGVRLAAAAPASGSQVLRVPAGVTVPQEVARLKRQRGVAYAVPNYIAHAAGSWIPDDPGRTGHAKGWELLQWNFLPGVGVNAPEAWANLFAVHRGGGRGSVVAILDTGVAYRDWHQFAKSPDFGGTRFADPYDLIANNRFPLDREGHGTFVAGTVAEATNNGIGLTGLAYGATIMPVRVLDADGEGDAATISRGIRYAAAHGAQVINLSLEFDISITSADIPDIVSAIAFAHRRGAVVVAAAGNDSSAQLAYPARAPEAISVGATTRDRCLANYSNVGPRLNLVAPGGGEDSTTVQSPDCHPGRRLPDVFQMTFADPANPRRFSISAGLYGTSMAAPQVAAIAALVIASGVLGRHPSPDEILARLEQTAQPLGGSKPNADYGYGLVDAGAATAATSPQLSLRHDSWRRG